MQKIQVASFEPDTGSIFYSLKNNQNIESVKDILENPIILNINGTKYKFHEFKDSIQITENKLKILEDIIENKKTLNINRELIDGEKNLPNDLKSMSKNIIFHFGIKNIGNSCYINSVMQFLLAFKPMKFLIYQNEDEINKLFEEFTTFIKLKIDEESIKESIKENNFYIKFKDADIDIYKMNKLFSFLHTIEMVKDIEILKKLIIDFKNDIFNHIEKEKNSTISDPKFIKNFKKKIPKFNNENQQDAEEVLSSTNIIVILMYMLGYKYNNFFNLLDEYYYKTKNNNKKEYITKRKDNFNYLKVSIKKDDEGVKSMIYYINKNMLNEKELEKGNSVSIEGKENENNLKLLSDKKQYRKTFILPFIENQYPEQFIIQLKRMYFDYDKDTRTIISSGKINTKISELNNIKIPFTLPDGTTNDIEYILNSVVIHQGNTIKSGHYYTYKKINNDWYEFNDSSVDKVDYNNIEDNISTNGYIFLYDKKND